MRHEAPEKVAGPGAKLAPFPASLLPATLAGLHVASILHGDLAGRRSHPDLTWGRQIRASMP
jgi:hypothetical protein